MKSKIQIDLSVIIYQEDAWWIAHCLEMDVPAEGDTPNRAVENLIDLINLQITTAIDHGDLEGIFRPAPAPLWRMYWLGQEKKGPSHRPRKAVKPVNRLTFRELALV